MDNEIACNNTDNKPTEDVEQLQDQHKGNNVENDRLRRQCWLTAYVSDYILSYYGN